MGKPDIAKYSPEVSLLEVAAVKRTFGGQLLALAHRGVPRELASDPVMHGLPDEEAKDMARCMRDTWPAS